MSKELDKFYLFLKNYIVDILNKIEALSFKVDDNVEVIIENRKKILEIDKSLSNDINLISFFYSEGITDAPQVKNSIKRIVKSLKNSKGLIDDLTKEKEKCEDILNNKEYDFDFFVKMLEKSNLNEKEKLEILKSLALSSCFIDQKKEEVKEDKKDEIKETKKVNKKTPKKLPDLELVVEKEEVKEENKTQELLDRYNGLKERINNINTSYHHLIQGKNESQIRYYESYVEATKSIKSETEKFEFKEYKLIVEIIRLLKCRDEVEELIKDNNLDEELLLIGITEIEDLLSSIDETSKDLSKQLDENNLNNSNIYFFSEDGMTSYFDVSKLDGDEKKIALNFIKDIENGRLDSPISSTKKVLMEETHDYNIYVYLKNKMGISFIKTGLDKLFIMTLANVKTLYSETASLAKRYDRQIKDQMNLINSGDKEFLEKQNNMLSSIKEDLSSGRKM